MKIKNKNYLMMVLVFFLLIFSIAQTIQIDSIKEQIETGEINTPVTTSQRTAESTRIQAPATMVGGC